MYIYIKKNVEFYRDIVKSTNVYIGGWGVCVRTKLRVPARRCCFRGWAVVQPLNALARHAARALPFCWRAVPCRRFPSFQVASRWLSVAPRCFPWLHVDSRCFP